MGNVTMSAQVETKTTEPVEPLTVGLSRNEIYGHPYGALSYGYGAASPLPHPGFNYHAAKLHAANIEAGMLHPYVCPSGMITNAYSARYGYSPGISTTAAPLPDRAMGAFGMETALGGRTYSPYGGDTGYGYPYKGAYSRTAVYGRYTATEGQLRGLACNPRRPAGHVWRP